MIPRDEDPAETQRLKSPGTTKDFSVKDRMQKDAELNHVEADDMNLLPAELKRWFKKIYLREIYLQRLS